MRNELHLTAEEMPDVAKQAAFTQAHLKQMGVKIFDDKGNMRSMIDIFKDMGLFSKMQAIRKSCQRSKQYSATELAGALAIFNHIQTGRLDEVLTKVKNANGATQQMAERMQNTTIGAYKEFLSAAESIAISFGSVLLPQLAEIMRYGAGWANQLSTLAEQHPQLSKAIGYTVIGLISLKISAIAVGYAFTFVRGLGFPQQVLPLNSRHFWDFYGLKC